MPSFVSAGYEHYYRDEGHGHAILLIHAFPLNSAMWESQIIALSKDMRVLAPDLRGFGATQPGHIPESLNEYADDLIALLNHVGLKRVVICGLSMGGYISFALLRKAPERIAALILADTRAGADSEEGRAGRLVNAHKAETEGVLAVGEPMLSRLVAPGAADSLRDQLRTLMVANSPEGVAAALRSMAVRPDSTPLLSMINVPTLIIVGREDVLTPPAESQAMHAAIKGSSLLEIPDVGHLTNLEAPEAFNQAVVKFLQTAGLY